MNMCFIDWAIVAALLIVMTIAAYRTKKYTRTVADFLVANRCAGRYILGVSDAMAGVGAISIVAAFEAYYRSGFTYDWWRLLFYATIIIISLSGWIQYRFRQTRALTMAQFLEMRYSKNFRILAGITAFVSGTLNFGIFPAVGARFFKYFCGLPSYEVSLFGVLSIDLTYALIMSVLLAMALYFTFAGGQIAVIVTDFIQGTFFNIIIVITLIVLFVKFPWSNIVEAISQRPPGKSMIDPFDAGQTQLFNPWYHTIQAFATFWCWLTWLGNQGYSGSARNAHEARMGRVMGSWRLYTQGIVVVVIAIAAYTIMHHPNWIGVAGSVNETLNTISNDAIQEQVTVSVALTKILPIGLMGCFCAMMLAAFISTHDTYLHSWGSIFIQDIVLPFRKKPIGTKEHLRMLKWSIFGVAAFIFLFSLLFRQYDAILMFFALTAILWLGGGGTVVVFGMYWKRGTTAAAYGSMIVSIVAFIFSATVQQVWPRVYGTDFPLNSQWLFFYTMIASITVYILISLFGKREVFDLDRLLHHGKYAIADDSTEVTDKPVRGWQAVFGMNKDFTFADKIIYSAITVWTVASAAAFFIVLAYKAMFGISKETWTSFWHFYVWMVLVLTVGTTIWFTFGGLIDLKKMFERLETMKHDKGDDGTVAKRNEEN
jgi:solute:Na+ symporter, SSS family